MHNEKIVEEYYHKLYCTSRTSTVYKTAIWSRIFSMHYRSHYVLAIIKILSCADVMGNSSQATSALCEADTFQGRWLHQFVTEFRERWRVNFTCMPVSIL